jgi:hypothetical protein
MYALRLRHIWQRAASRLKRRQPLFDKRSPAEDLTSIRRDDTAAMGQEDNWLAQQIVTYRHAFETTAADRDRLAAELETYRHAFETTVDDRDRIQQERDQLTSVVAGLLEKPAILDAIKRSMRALPPAPRLLKDVLATFPDAREASSNANANLRLPNVYCVGAPKSGTSFFYSIFRQHSLIFVSEKDTGNIIDLIWKFSQPNPAETIHKITLFAEHENRGYSGQPLLCNFEAGFYIYPAGAEMIATYLDPDARILIFLRDPVKRLVSEYAMRTRQYDPERMTFVEPEDLLTALELSSERRAARPALYFMYYAYIEMSDYFNLVKKFTDRFGVSNVKVVIMELDVVENVEVAALECFAFLGLADAEATKIAFADHSQYAAMSRTPSHIKVRFISDDGCAHDDPTDIASLFRSGINRIEIRSDVPEQLDLVVEAPTEATAIAAATLASRHSIKLSIDQERKLYDTWFRKGVKQLEQLIGRDLSCWYCRY